MSATDELITERRAARPRHLLDVTDLDGPQIAEVLDLAAMPAAALGAPFAGRGVALVFEKPSNRTRHSMEMAVVQLGGHPVYTRGEEVGFDTREPVEDIARILAGYHAMIGARVFDHRVLERMVAALEPVGAEIGMDPSASVVNMLSDRSHPLQAFADALTMRSRFGELAGRSVAWIGDYNNVARSLGEIAALSGMTLRFAGPGGFEVPDAELDRFIALGAPEAIRCASAREAARGADAVHTDTWVSMGQEADKTERVRAFQAFQVDTEVMAAANADAVFMHCLPAYRGLEVAAEVIDGPSSVVIEQGHNRLHAARGLLAHLLGVRPDPSNGNPR